MKRLPVLSFLLALLLLIAATPRSSLTTTAPDPTMPLQTVKLIFIHHSTGENWLRDDYGGLGQALTNNNYFVSDTNYGRGPDSIGDRTDIPNWTEWFASDQTPTYMDALFNESGQNSEYTRLPNGPGGENQIIMFKSCFPNSALEGNPTDPPDPDGWLSVGHAKYVYNETLQYFSTRPDKLFIVITAPPLSDPTYAENARAFNQWLVNDWLDENNYTLPNVAVFDFYNILTGFNAHHWWNNGQIEHILGNSNTLAYPSGDDHPSEAGSLKATSEFVPLLNIFYNRWAATISFADVPSTHWAYSWINRLYKAGITTGCGTKPLIYCPEDSVTRAQMAVFLERGVHGSTYQPPAVGAGSGFNDVSTSYWAAAWIKQLAADGITTGCGGGNYCPEGMVTRGQMAVFLLRARYGAAYIPPTVGSTTGFYDVPTTYWAAAWIKQLAAEGITTGCSSGNYCPEDSVTRAQMAVFLVRTFNLP